MQWVSHRLALGFFIGSGIGIVLFGRSLLPVVLALVLEGVVLWLHVRPPRDEDADGYCSSSDSGV